MVKDTSNTEMLSYGDISVPDLLGKARDVASQAHDPYKQIVEVYYIARYFMSWFESREAPDVPIQVWNEYRMAMDHFMRSLTSSEPESEAQLRRMDAHIQRAALDVLKLLFTSMSDSCTELLSGYSQSCINTLLSGDFRNESTRLRDSAQLQYHHAKMTDSESKASGDFDKYSLEDRCPGIAAYAEAVMQMYQCEGYLKSQERHLATLEIELQRSSKEGHNRGRVGYWTSGVALAILGVLLSVAWTSVSSPESDTVVMVQAENAENVSESDIVMPSEVMSNDAEEVESLHRNAAVE